MRCFPSRAAVVLTAVALAAPASGCAQVQAHVLLGVGLNSPSGSFSKVAGPGYLGNLGLQAELPHFPLALRVDGEVNRFPSASSPGHVLVVSGSASLVVLLHAMGLSPYVLAGIGEYSASVSDIPFSSSIGTGYQAGVGLRFGGAGAIGGFVEVRLVSAGGSNDYKPRYFPITVGLRL